MRQEWQKQLRSSLHPALFAGVYLVADKVAALVPFLHLVRPEILVLAPKVVQAVFSAVGDWCTWQLAVRLFGAGADASWCAVSCLSSGRWDVADKSSLP